MKTISEIVKAQKLFFETHTTLDLNFRIEQLKKLKSAFLKYEAELMEALKKDLGKSEFEAFTNELGMAQKEFSFHIMNLKKMAKCRRVPTPIFAFPSSSHIAKQPYGKILIIGPFNFPFMLTVIPLIGAISAGNTAVVKPSENTLATSEWIDKIISETFDPEYVACVQGGVDVTTELLAQRWDKIFFTGSTRVGKIVMEAAAKNLIPVILELGGKNPVVVDIDANLEIAAKKIIWGKFLNAGQSCVAPDYLLVHKEVKDKLLPLLKKATEQFYTEHPKSSPDFGRIINAAAVERLSGLVKNEKILVGGDADIRDNYFSPTILTDVNADSPVMQDEIFGPVLPVLTFNDLTEAIGFINKREKPLALYYFSDSRKKQKEFLSNTFSGGAGINELVIHFINFSLPFGGVGYSGMGSYHGKHSFDAFSHTRLVMKTTTLFDLPLRYAPPKKWFIKLMRLFLR